MDGSAPLYCWIAPSFLDYSHPNSVVISPTQAGREDEMTLGTGNLCAHINGSVGGGAEGVLAVSQPFPKS